MSENDFGKRESGDRAGVWKRARGWRWWGWLVLAVTIGAGSITGVGQVPDAPIRGFALPLMDRDTLALKARIRGDVAQRVGGNRMELQGVRLEVYEGADRTNLVVTTERCFLLEEERRLESPGELLVLSGDDQLRLTGEGFSWGAESGLTISNRVEAELQRPASAAVGAFPGPPMLIRSSRFRYGGGEAGFEGGVSVAEGMDRLRCERLTLGFRLNPGEVAPSVGGAEVGERVDRIVAEESVEVASADLVASADRAVYDMTGGTVEMSGRARWRSGEREGEAEEIRLDRVADRLEASGGVRVRVPVGSLVAGGASGGGGLGAGAEDERVEVIAKTFEVAPDPVATHLRRAIFSEEVRVMQGDRGMRCELLLVRYAQAVTPDGSAVGETPGAAGTDLGFNVEDAQAVGGVNLWQTTNRVDGAEAFYTAASGIIEMAGPVNWWLEGREGRSDRLRLHPVEGLTEALGGVRMRLPAGSMGPINKVLGQSEASRTADGTAAEAGGGAQPVEVSCTDFRYREAGKTRPFGVAEFLGGVDVTSGSTMQMRSERMIAEMPRGTNHIHRLVAVGEVQIRAEDLKGSRVARGDRAEYLAAEDRLWLTGEQGVEMELSDEDGVHRGRGRLAVYDGARDVLELRSGAVLDSVHGRLTGEVVRVDRLQHILAAGGGWRIRFPVKAVEDTFIDLDRGGGEGP